MGKNLGIFKISSVKVSPRFIPFRANMTKFDIPDIDGQPKKSKEEKNAYLRGHNSCEVV